MSTNTTLPKWLKFANRLIIAFNRLGMSFGTWYILSIPGRKTGKMRSTPVSVPHGVPFFEKLLNIPGDPEALAEAAPRCPVFRLDGVLQN